MWKNITLIMCAVIACSGQTCGININPIQSTPLNDADAEITISRAMDEDSALVVADITRGFARVRLDSDQNVAANETDLVGGPGDYHASIDAADTYDVAVTDPRRGTDHTQITEPSAFEIDVPGEGGDASLSGFTIGWTDSDPALEVDITISQILLGENLSLVLDRRPDSGAATVSSSMIAEAGFGQGRPLTITVAKRRTNNNLRGFRDGVLISELSTSIDVTPKP